MTAAFDHSAILPHAPHRLDHLEPAHSPAQHLGNHHRTVPLLAGLQRTPDRQPRAVQRVRVLRLPLPVPAEADVVRLAWYASVLLHDEISAGVVPRQPHHHCLEALRTACDAIIRCVVVEVSG